MIKFTTLWDYMKEFKPELLADLIGRLGEVIGTCSKLNKKELQSDIDDATKKQILEQFELYQKLCVQLHLAMSAATLEKFISSLLSKDGSTNASVAALCSELRGRLVDEMELQKFFSIERDKEQFLLGKDLFGTKVTVAFPSAIIDIEEAGKCIALERWTASVFHLSRVSEIAMVNIGKRVGYESPKPGFGEVLAYMDAQLEKVRKDRKNALPGFLDDTQFLSAVTAQMHAVNQAWRQRVAHLDTKYTEEEALRIWSATKGLMEQIAEQLTEENV